MKHIQKQENIKPFSPEALRRKPTYVRRNRALAVVGVFGLVFGGLLVRDGDTIISHKSTPAAMADNDVYGPTADAQETVLPQATTSTAVPLVDFTHGVTDNLGYAFTHDESDEHGSHSCENIPIVNEATAPNMTTTDGWVQAVNIVRDMAGRDEVYHDAALENTAQQTADYLAEKGLFNHVGTSNAGVHLAADETTFDRIGENLVQVSPPHDSDQSQIGAFLCLVQSRTHLQNMLNPHIGALGVGRSAYRDGQELYPLGIVVMHLGG